MRVPDPLQVCWLRTRLRTADQQIPAELKIQHRQMRIVLLCKIRDALIGGLIDRGCATQIQGDAIKKRLIKLLMLPQQRGVRFIGGLLDRKSTRLNSSHVKISYAVFCLKKKNRRYKRISAEEGKEDVTADG